MAGKISTNMMGV